MQPYA
jgi:hypothetical protein